MTFEKFRRMYTQAQTAPQFFLFAKRRSSHESSTSIYAKIIYQRKAHEKSMNIICRYDSWDSENMLIKDRPVETNQLKISFEELKQKVMGAYYVLKQQNPDFTLHDIIDLASGSRTPGILSFIQCFQDVITRMEKSKGNEGNSPTNIQKHQRCLDHLRAFMKESYRLSDMPFGRINRSTIDDLTEYLKTTGKCSHNTAMKYMQIIKKIYRVGIDNGWVRVNAFANFKFKIKVVERNCLTEEELNVMVDKHFDINRLEYVKDLFLFSCFTGLAYIDIKNLKRSNIIQNNGRDWIKNKRAKTGVEASIPLLDPAMKILKKYCPEWIGLEKDKLLFDVISNQKLNAYLKEIARLCKIDKEITFHLARHTFATTVTLSNDIPLETVSKMLGHSRITMTQHYSKVIDSKIARDTEQLMSKFAK
jgi:site-specific recombinase XerD